jgi:predicted lactoylglutathione lyase
MAKEMFVNLPVKDLPRSMAFFRALGFDFNMDFTNEQGACMVVGPNIYAMLLTEPFFRTFTDKTVIDAHSQVEVLVCISVDDRASVDDLVAKARAAGGKVPREPQDHGFMYGHGFQDLDGHVWEVIAMAS